MVKICLIFDSLWYIWKMYHQLYYRPITGSIQHLRAIIHGREIFLSEKMDREVRVRNGKNYAIISLAQIYLRRKKINIGKWKVLTKWKTSSIDLGELWPSLFKADISPNTCDTRYSRVGGRKMQGHSWPLSSLRSASTLNSLVGFLHSIRVFRDRWRRLCYGHLVTMN